MSLPTLQKPATSGDAGLDSDTLRDLQQGLDELRKNTPKYKTAGRYYDGKVPEVFASIKMRRAMQQHGVDFDFNFAKTPVDAIADRLEITSIIGSDSTQTRAIQQLWKDNELALEAPSIHRKTGTYGDACVIVWPIESDESDNGTGGVTGEPGVFDQATKVGIYYNPPEQCRVIYDTEYPRLIRYAIKRWTLARPVPTIDRSSGQTTHPPVRVDLLYADRIEHYITARGKEGRSARDFVRYQPPDTEGGEDGWRVENPYGRVPVFHFRTDRPYGCPDHFGFYGPQNAITKLIISHLAGVDFTAAPQRYALVASESDSSEAGAVDEDQFALSLDDEDETGTIGDRPARGESSSSYKADPGSLWLMRGVTGVGQFQTADPKVFLDPVITYIKSGAQITGTPLHYFDVSGQVPSGESLRAAEAPHNKKIRNRQLSYGATWRDLFVFALRIMGISGAEVVVNWAPPATVDDVTGWQTVAAKLAAGVPPHQALMEAGYTDDQVKDWAPKMDTAQLLQIAQILVQLGTAATLGVLDRSTVEQLVEQLIPGGHAGQAPAAPPAPTTGQPSGQPARTARVGAPGT